MIKQTTLILVRPWLCSTKVAHVRLKILAHFCLPPPSPPPPPSHHHPWWPLQPVLPPLTLPPPLCSCRSIFLSLAASFTLGHMMVVFLQLSLRRCNMSEANWCSSCLCWRPVLLGKQSVPRGEIWNLEKCNIWVSPVEFCTGFSSLESCCYTWASGFQNCVHIYKFLCE